jgi:allophanate hydrolase
LLGARPRGAWRLPADASASEERTPRVAIPLPAQLDGLADGWAEAFAAAVTRLRAAGVDTAEVDMTPLLEAATLLYGGAFVAERYTAVGGHVAANTGLIGTELDPVVARIILDGARFTAAELFADQEKLDGLAARAATALAGFDALLTPTTTAHPTLADVAADPVGVNSRLGRYTNFANLLDLASIAVPAGTVRGLPFGIMLTGPAGSDERLAEIAGRYDQAPVDMLVVGAHLSGQPLNHEVLAAGGTLVGQVATAKRYRLLALGTMPPKPGLVRQAEGGASIAGEVWRLPAAGFARFMTGLATPMAVGRVFLDDGRDVLGFVCEPAAALGADDITDYGGWRAWRDRP